MHEQSTVGTSIEEQDPQGNTQTLKFPSSTDADLIRRLSMQENKDPLRAHLEDVAYDFIYENPEFADTLNKNIAIIRSPKANEEEKRIAAAENRALNLQAQQIILDHIGIQDVILDEIVHARNEITHIITKDKEEKGDLSDPLIALGILTTDKDGNDRFTYPRALFPPCTTEKWHKYLSAVKDHIDAAELLKGPAPHTSQTYVVEKDNLRRLAHNAVSKDVQRLLGLPNTEEGFEEARKLVAKMRENRFPTIETGERGRIAGQIGGSVVSILRSSEKRFFDPESASYDYR